MATIRDLKNRIRAVENIRKITRAMQLVAAAKLNRAQQRAQSVRPFADELDRVLGGLAGGGIEESADVAIEFAAAEVFESPLRSELQQAGFPVREGRIDLPQRAGIGYELPPDLLQRFRLDD